MERLQRGLREMGLSATPAQVDQLALYRGLLQDWNRVMNLTAITEDEAIETAHFLDALTVLPLLPEPLPESFAVLDVGTGAGFPGLPLRILRPSIRLTLLESVGKKTRFLDAVRNALGLADVEVVTARAEDAGHMARLRERFDLVVARAVASMATLAELCLPFCAVGGRFIAYKKGESLTVEMQEAAEALRVLGGAVEDLHPVHLSPLPDERVLVVVRKKAPTPMISPRRAGVPAKRPLGVSGATGARGRRA